MISPLLYSTAYLSLVVILSIMVALSLNNKSYSQIRYRHPHILYPFIICVILALWLGNRPEEYYHVFGDSFTYAHNYHLFEIGQLEEIDEKGEVIWNGLMRYSSQRITVVLFFTIVSCLYFGFTLWASVKFTRNNPLVTFLFFLGSLSYYTYAVNGLRNGLACSIVLVGIAFLVGKIYTRWFALVCFVIAYYIHRSTVLPVSMVFLSLIMRKYFKLSIIFWLLSILISATLGNTITNLLVGLGFDDRVEAYLVTNSVGDAHAGGFRWDFLLYSAMPIVLGYYVIIHRKVADRTYLILMNAYTLTNAFWVMIIRASFSNRIAYLSWFMYPIVLAYPLLKLNVWGDLQGKNLSHILLAQVAFTWVMQILIWS